MFLMVSPRLSVIVDGVVRIAYAFFDSLFFDFFSIFLTFLDFWI